MTIGTNRMCISRDDNCVNTTCFPRQLPTTTRNLLSWLSSTGAIRIVLSVTELPFSFLLCGEFLKRRIFSVCQSFLSMCQSCRMKGFERCFKVEDQCNILRPPAKGKQINLYECHFEPFGERKIPPGIK